MYMVLIEGIERKSYYCCNKMCLTLSPLSFDDKKVLKSQLDMLIFVQVCKTTYKKFICLKFKYWF